MRHDIAAAGGQTTDQGRLTGAGVGTTLRVTGLQVPEGHRLRLAQHGVRVGARVTVVGHTSGGGRVLGIGATRLAVDRATARRVEVAAG